MATIDLTQTPIPKMGGAIEKETQAMVADVVVQIRLADLRDLIKRGKKKFKKVLKVNPITVVPIQIEPAPMVPDKVCAVVEEVPTPTVLIAEEPLIQMVQPIEVAEDQSDLGTTTQARILGQVECFSKDRRMTINVKQALQYIQLRSDGSSEVEIRRALNGIDASEFAGIKQTLDKYATTYRLTESGEDRKFLLDELKRVMPQHGVPQ